jgi:hypothetical protein
MTPARNHGGRIDFTVGQEVYRINLDGTVTQEKYTIVEPRSDRHGLIGVRDHNSEMILRVHNSRIIPTDLNGEALVVEVADKYYVICSNCGTSTGYVDGNDAFVCSSCQKQSQFRWMCQRPIGKIIKPQIKKAAKKESLVVDISAIKSLANCELWAKKMAFDHPSIDARSYLLVFNDGTDVRKLCFNTYNGKLGKKAKPLPIDGFLSGEGQGWYKTTVKNVQRDITNGKYERLD